MMWKCFDIGCGILVVLGLFLLGGCGPNYKVVKEYHLSQGSNIRPAVNGQAGTPGAPVNIMYLRLDADVESTTTAEQRAANDVAAALGLNGSTPSLAGSGAVLTASEIASQFAQWQENKAAAREPAEIPVAVLPVTGSVPPAAAPETPQEQVQHTTTETHSLRALEGNNKRFTWLPQTGEYYGGPIMFEFPGCGDLRVPDAGVSIGADGSTGKNQAFYFCGTDFPPDSKENNNNMASVFAPPGCPADSVILHYNRE